MIPSYQEEIRKHRSKDRIFWLVVVVMTVFLYFFFQGYYPNYERFMDRTDSSKQTFLKPFGIIDIHVFPSPDDIRINSGSYNNNSKTIFDIGTYTVSIQKKGYISINFLLDINKKNPFYTNVVNLLMLPEPLFLPLTFDTLSRHDDSYILRVAKTGVFLITDMDFQPLHRIETMYQYIGGLYFTDGKNIFSYREDTEKFSNMLDPKTGLALQCTHVSYYAEKLFCHDTMQFIGPKSGDIHEQILSINDRIVVTPRYIYNQDETDTNWKYFEYATGIIQSPDSLVHIRKIPYIFEKGVLSPLDKVHTIATPIDKSDWGMDTISQAQDMDGETILLGEKGNQGRFQIIDSEKQYSGIFDFAHTGDVRVQKVSGVYVFTTPKSAYLYYKGAQEIVKILDDVHIIQVVDAKIFFNKEGKSYVVDLLRKEGK